MIYETFKYPNKTMTRDRGQKAEDKTKEACSPPIKKQYTVGPLHPKDQYPLIHFSMVLKILDLLKEKILEIYIFLKKRIRTGH